MNIQQALTYASNQLKEGGINLHHLEARILLQYSTQKSLEYLLLNSNKMLSVSELTIFRNSLNKRLEFEPIAYITNLKEFYGYEFIVNKDVLIPREDTEILVSEIIKEMNISKSFDHKILELGVGSGCIAISLLLEIPNSIVVATDISLDAIKVAEQNAKKHNVENRITFIQSNWFKELKKTLVNSVEFGYKERGAKPIYNRAATSDNVGEFKSIDYKYDFIVSNPPYISQDEISHMTFETLKYEPSLALFGENNGLIAYSIIAENAKKFLADQGKLYLEIGFKQQQAISDIFINYGYKLEKICKDLAGHSRAMIFSIR